MHITVSLIEQDPIRSHNKSKSTKESQFNYLINYLQKKTLQHAGSLALALDTNMSFKIQTLDLHAPKNAAKLIIPYKGNTRKKNILFVFLLCNYILSLDFPITKMEINRIIRAMLDQLSRI